MQLSSSKSFRFAQRDVVLRHAVLKLGSLCAAGLAGGAAEKAATTSGIVDAHVHVWTADTAKYPLWRGFTKTQMRPPSFTPKQLFAHCRSEGVKKIVELKLHKDEKAQFQKSYRSVKKLIKNLAL